MTTLLLTAALLATVPQDAVLRDRCCCLEINPFSKLVRDDIPEIRREQFTNH